jgi:WD40 repeat protein
MTTAVLLVVALAAEPVLAVDRFGDPLPPGAVARLGTLRYRSPWPITHPVVLPDGRQVAFAAAAAVFVLDLNTGKTVRRIIRTINGRESTDPVTALSIAPDGRTLAIGCREFGTVGETTMTFWLGDVATGAVLREFPGRSQPVRALAFLADGRQVAALDYAGGAGIWDTATGAKVRELAGFGHKLTCLAASPDGRSIATGAVANDRAAPIYVSDAATGKLLHTLAGHALDVKAVAFTPDGRTLVSGGNATVRLWDVGNGRELRQLRGHAREGAREFKHSVGSLAISPDGRLVASASTDLTARVWSVTTGQPVDDMAASAHETNVLAFRDARTLLVGGAHMFRLRDVQARVFTNHDAGAVWGIGFLAFSPDGRAVVTADVDSTVHVWDAAEGRHLSAKVWSPMTAITLVSPDGRWVAVTEPVDGKDVVGIGDVSAGRIVRRLKGADQMPAAFSPDGGTLVTLGVGPNEAQQFSCVAWDVAQGTKLGRVETPPVSPNCLAVAPGGRSLFAAALNQPVQRWNVGTGRSMQKYSMLVHVLGQPQPQPVGVNALTVSHGGRLIAIACGDATIRLVDVATGEECWRSQIAGKVQTEGVAISPDGSTVATGYNNQLDRQIDLWDARTGKRLASLRGHSPKSVVNGLAFSPDGRRLASAGTDGTALVWDVEAVTGRQAVGVLDAAQQAQLWEDLSGSVVSVAHAIDCLQAAPSAAVTILNARLAPAAAVPANRVAPLVAALDGPTFATREKAQRDLAALGPGAEPALTAARTTTPVEARRRIDLILDGWQGQQRRAGRAIEVLENVGTSEALKLLEELATGDPAARLTREAKASLERLALTIK